MDTQHSNFSSEQESENPFDVISNLPVDDLAPKFDSTTTSVSKATAAFAEIPNHQSPSPSSSPVLPSSTPLSSPHVDIDPLLHDFCETESPLFVQLPFEAGHPRRGTVDVTPNLQAIHSHHSENSRKSHPVLLSPSSLPQSAPSFRKDLLPNAEVISRPNDLENATPYRSPMLPNGFNDFDEISLLRTIPTASVQTSTSSHTMASSITANQDISGQKKVAPTRGKNRTASFHTSSADIRRDEANMLHPCLQDRAASPNAASLPSQLHIIHDQQCQSTAVFKNHSRCVSIDNEEQIAQPHHQHSQYAAGNEARAKAVDSTFHPTYAISERRNALNSVIVKHRHHGRTKIRNLYTTRVRCPRCPELFETKINADRHLRGCHQTPKLAYPCTYCSASYDGKGARTIHQKKAHADQLKGIPVANAQVRPVNDS